MASHDAALTSAVVDALDDVVFATDPQGRLSYLNPAWTVLTGISWRTRWARRSASTSRDWRRRAARRAA